MSSQALSRNRAHQPCAACRMLRRRCDSNCILAPYFPGDEAEKFFGVHKVFGASNVIRMIQMVEESKKEDAVKAIIYEARSRLRDPVYGSAGTIFHLQRMVEELKMQVESMRAQVVQLQEQRNQLLGFLMNVRHLDSTSSLHGSKFDGGNFMLDEDSIAYDPITYFTENDWTF
ncbi:PREDICTED: LOB domain-containing protein 1-like [Populus euphratica]|uniref:LOB domain-containing protein 1-like n=1 Tax=Populus euphratica TaxID=75702 RepID=A0AAJ6TFL0_POPEU|nr:PREDICTED: LOB domain-containing protein 1-like [Populus euphratica]